MPGTIHFKKGHDRKITYLSHGPSLSEMVTFAGQIAPYTNADITKVTVTFREHTDLPGGEGEYNTTDLYAHIFMRDVDEDVLYAVKIPAPIESMFDHISSKGFKVKDSIGEVITLAYAELSGLNLEFHQGWLCGKGP